MTKVSRRKTCFYYGALCDSMDHIPSKLLLQKPFPNNLLTIPACIKCNNSFSKDEEYFLNVLVEITTNQNLLSKKEVGGTVYRARNRSKGLNTLVQNSLVQGDDGRIYFRGELNRIKSVVEKIAFGLYFHKYGTVANINSIKCLGFYPYNVDERRPAGIHLLTYSEKFRSKRWSIIQRNVFDYIVVRDWTRNNAFTMIFNIHNTAWCVVAIPFPKNRRGHKASHISQLSIREFLP